MTRAQINDRPSLPPRFSMLKSLTVADFITLINAVSGVSSIFASLSYAREGQLSYLWAAMALVCVAGVADFMDGRVARRSLRISTLGGDLDSLADLISLGVAPATLAFAVGMDGGWDWAVLVYFVCCGLSRLARYNVTVNAIAPGAATPMTETIRTDDRFREKYLARIPLGRWAEPKEIAPVFVFFASDGASYVTGQIVAADGGMTIR